MHTAGVGMHLKHCEQLNLISQDHRLPGVTDAWSPQVHIN